MDALSVMTAQIILPAVETLLYGISAKMAANFKRFIRNDPGAWVRLLP
jgi:hypothetical protein